MMYVSIIIPIYNAEQYIRDTFKSVLEQTYKNYEIIFVDDGSKDGCWELIKEWEQNYFFVSAYQITHSGVEKARNLGVFYAQHEWIAFLDADDMWHQEKLSLQINELEHNPDISLISTHAAYFNIPGNIFGLLALGPQNLTEYRHLVDKKKPCWVLTPSVVCKKEIFDLVGGFDPQFCGAAEDLDLWTRIAQKARIQCIPKELVYVRITDGSVSMRKHRLIYLNTQYIKYKLAGGEGNNDNVYFQKRNSQNIMTTLNEERIIFVAFIFRKAGYYYLRRNLIPFIAFLLMAMIGSPWYTLKKINNFSKGKKWCH